MALRIHIVSAEVLDRTEILFRPSLDLRSRGLRMGHNMGKPRREAVVFSMWPSDAGKEMTRQIQIRSKNKAVK